MEIEGRYLLLVVTIFFLPSHGLLGKLLANPFTWNAYFPLLLGGFEMGMLGYALFLSAYGSEHLGKWHSSIWDRYCSYSLCLWHS
jgi:hypothetical protein